GDGEIGEAVGLASAIVLASRVRDDSPSLAGDADLRLVSASRDDVDVHLAELAHQSVDRVCVDPGEIDVHAALAQTCLQVRPGEAGNHGPETHAVADQPDRHANRDLTVAAAHEARPHPGSTRMLPVVAGPVARPGDGDAQVLGGRS